ncbi:hypothetical protein OBBRIDRAFT_726209, partial [Obba rivulosa]
VLLVYSWPTFACIRKGACVCKEKNVPIELVSMNIFEGPHRSRGCPAYNASVRVPYIVENGIIFFESRIIGRCIATKYEVQGERVIPDPSGIVKHALFELATAIEQLQFDPFANAGGGLQAISSPCCRNELHVLYIS